jgi:hypothetical protein
MTDLYQTGRRYGARRANDEYGESRICQFDTCETVLSKYNKFTFCTPHMPYVQPRVRGAVDIKDV